MRGKRIPQKARDRRARGGGKANELIDFPVFCAIMNVDLSRHWEGVLYKTLIGILYGLSIRDSTNCRIMSWAFNSLSTNGEDIFIVSKSPIGYTLTVQNHVFRQSR
jgi:hypothetical protein